MKITITVLARYNDGVEVLTHRGKAASIRSKEKNKIPSLLQSTIDDNSQAIFTLDKLPPGVNSLADVPLLFRAQTSKTGGRSVNLKLTKKPNGYEGKAVFLIRRPSPKPPAEEKPIKIRGKLSLAQSPSINIVLPGGGTLHLTANKKDMKALSVANVNPKNFTIDWPELSKISDFGKAVFKARFDHPAIELETSFKFTADKTGLFANIIFEHDDTKNPNDDPAKPHFTVSGQVLLAENYGQAHAPFSNLSATIYARAPGKDKKLADLAVDGKGKFSGEIEIPEARTLQAKLYRGKVRAVLATSDIVVLKGDSAEFSLTLKKPKRKGTLFDHLDKVFSKITEPFPEDETERQLWYSLSEETPVDIKRYFEALNIAKILRDKAPDEIANFFQEYQGVLGGKQQSEVKAASQQELIMAKFAQLPELPEYVFALLREQPQGLDEYRLLNKSRSAIAKRLKAASAAKDISKLTQNEKDKIANGFALIRDGLNITFTEKANVNGALVLLADPKVKSATRLLDHLLDGHPIRDPETDNKAILAFLTKAEHARLETAKELLDAFENYRPMAGLFYARLINARRKEFLRPGEGRSLTPAKITERAAANSRDRWAALAKVSGVPGHHKEEKDAELHYADHIIVGLDVSSPRTQTLLQLRDDKSKSFTGLAQVLKRHPDFNPREQAVDDYFRERRISSVNRESLKTFARLTRIVPQGRQFVEYAGVIADSGYSSALDIISRGKLEFTDAMRVKLPADIITKTYCNARMITDMVGELRVQLAHSGINTQKDFGEILVAGGSQAPETLDLVPISQVFGAFNSCACTACESVHSPAAYLYNLLHWMKSDVQGAFPRLMEKRPDIADIKLSCFNTHTVLPYIDLVNEALCWTLDDNIVPPTETTWDEADLRLQPENRYGAASAATPADIPNTAEEQLKTKFFPASLPYYRSASEGRAAFSASGLNFSDVMATFLPADRNLWSDDQSANQKKAYRAAILGLDVELYDELIKIAVPSNFWTAYSGVTTPPGKNVGNIMRALGLDFMTTDSLIRLEFVSKAATGSNAFIAGEVNYHDTDCTYDNATYDNAFPQAAAWRAWRLLRLSNALDISPSTLNGLLLRYGDATGNGLEINVEFLAFLAGTRELAALAGVSQEATLAYLELGHANGTPERLEAFASGYTTRSAADLKLAKTYLDMDWVDLTKPEDMAAFLTNVQPMLASVQDVSKLDPYPLVGETSTRQTLFSGFATRIFDIISGTTLSVGDIDTVHAEIFTALTHELSLPVNLAVDIYAKRVDSWVVEFNSNTPPAAPSTVTGFEDFAQRLWQEWHFGWMMNALTVCNASADIISASQDKYGLPSDDLAPNYTNLHSDFAENIWMLNALVTEYEITEIELSGALIQNSPNWIPPWLGSAEDAVDQHIVDTSRFVVSAEKSLRLERQSRILGVLPAELSLLFTTAETPDWEGAETDDISANQAAQLFKRAAAAGNDEAFESAADEIRKNFRDALLDLIKATDPDFESLEDVYEWLLLDPGMQPCMMTSRLKLATNSVQLLMHRGMLNIEDGIMPDEDDQQQWTWRKNYRVWEANMKVLLYPENWIDPSLRTNPTPIFKQSIALLAQDEVNEETSEAVIYDYLSSLDKIARLDIRAFYRDESEGILHVFGRSWVAPYEHYYRRREDGVWTHWEKIDIDIEADHIIPVMFHRRLWLFWPIFIEKQTKDTEVDYKEIRLAYTTYEFGKWRGKKLLGKSIEAGPKAGVGTALNLAEKTVGSHSQVGLEPEHFLFIAERFDDNTELRIMVRRVFTGGSDYRTGYTEMEYEDSWSILGCNNEGEVVEAGYGSSIRDAGDIVSRPFMTLPHGQNMRNGYDGYEELGGAALYAKRQRGHVGDPIPLLDEAPKNYTLTYPQKKHALWHEPFFMMDNNHTHFYERELYCTTVLGWHFIQLKESYEVDLHEHPYACLMISRFNQFGIDGIYARNGKSPDLRRQAIIDQKYFSKVSTAMYNPGDYGRINSPWPKLEFDFTIGSAYGAYNWELFFHLPTMIARQLKTSGRHAEAIRWLSMIYDPTSRENLGKRRVWQIKPFMEVDSRTDIAALIRLLGQNPSTSQQTELRKSFEAQLKAWRETPFEPHRIAEHRLSAYMMWAVLEYVDILIEWGDKLFKEDSMESINEATNLYMMANEILGKRPEIIPSGKTTSSRSFSYLVAQTSGANSDWANDLEGWMAAPTPENGCRPDSCGSSVFGSLSPKNYFCIPPNPKLPEYWDRVEDRLFKIRHCRNFTGEERALALFQPPIDPAMLVRARAAGLSVADAIASVSDKGMGYRFQFLLQKAQDFTSEVRNLGGQLLSAIEKQNAEELLLIRQTHELNIQKVTRNLKKMSIAEAKETLKGLIHSRNGAQISHDYFVTREKWSTSEKTSRNLSYLADGFMVAEQSAMLVSGLITVIPDVNLGTVTFTRVIGGDKLADAVKSSATALGVGGSLSRSGSARAATRGSYERRWDDWLNQADVTQERLNELDRQIVAAEIRLQTAEKDLELFETQIAQSEEIYDFMKSKFSNEQLYSWMVRELKTLHYRVFDIAANMARQAQKAANRELRTNDLSYISANHWDSGRAGLLAGERLSVELRELDNAYWKARDEQTIFELSRTVSLRRLDPDKLFKLKSGINSVSISLPEWLFKSVHNQSGLTDMLIQSVAISLPCTTGPNTKVDLKLTLDSHGVNNESYQGPSDKSVITSSAQLDAGRFDPNPGGSQYLPFENASVISTWTLELPNRLEFDPATINDVIFHVRYTAVSDPNPNTQTISALGSFAVSLRHDFYDRWLNLLADTGPINLSNAFPSPMTSDSVPVIDPELESRTPYIYLSAGSFAYGANYFVSTRDDNGKVLIEESNGSGISAEGGKLKFNSREVVDIIAVVAAS